MTISSPTYRTLFGAFIAALVLSPAAAQAGPGFIENARVSTVGDSADVEVRFNCKAEYLRHEPQGRGDRLRVYLDPTAICNGVSPVVAESRTRLRPLNSDTARLMDIEYDGDPAAGPVLTLNFSDPVTFDVDMSSLAFELVVHVRPATEPVAATSEPVKVLHRQVDRENPPEPDYAINLASLRRIPTGADAPGLELAADQRLYYHEVVVDGTTWYRLRMGNFATAESAASTLEALKSTFPGAWIDEVGNQPEIVITRAGERKTPTTEAAAPTDLPALSKVDSLMEDARKSMAAGEISRAVQIYTKIMQLPEHPRQPQAQEYLALAREKKGQNAHAKAEYERYLALYPQEEGAARVKQRLAALLATDRNSNAPPDSSGKPGPTRAARNSDWRIQTYFSQYYRRDVNQQNDEDEIVSQSALYSDINLDIRRRGERFDFSSRLSAGYRNDFLDESVSSGNELRVSYAYIDLADAETGIRGRVGRQTRNTGGVLGRFDGINLGYDLGERFALNAVAGKPAYSSSDGINSARTFLGASINYGPFLEDLELGLYAIQQDIEGLDDRQAIGAEFRYFGSNRSFWGLVDYDTLYDELGSAFLQGSWRFASRLTLHGSIDRRHSPFLSTGNALIGQPVIEFEQLLELLPLEEIRQLGVDRSPLSTTYSLGFSHSLSPKLQINADVNDTSVEATPESGGVAATPETSYRYYGTSLVASSLLKEGDVTILGTRYSDSGTARVVSLTIDSRYPFGRSWRLNPRLRVDRRQRMADDSYEWLYTPGIRLQYRRGQRFRVLLEAGRPFAERESATLDIERESYYMIRGDQAFFGG